jgi:hypothetical protein
MSFKLSLLGGQTERIQTGLVISAYTITAYHDGADREVDHANSRKEAKEKIARWRAENPKVKFRIV